MTSFKTAKKWADRDAAEGPAGMSDRSSARHTQAKKTPQPVGLPVQSTNAADSRGSTFSRLGITGRFVRQRGATRRRRGRGSYD
jgi:hypothetical protein